MHDSQSTAIYTPALALVVALLSLLVFAPGAASAQSDPAPSSGAVQLPDGTPGGGRFTTPVAVPNTLNLGDTDPNGIRSNVADTVRNCLEISGYFDVYGPDRYFFDPSNEGMTAASINFENWYNTGAQGLIKTAFRVAGNQVSLDFRLYNVDTQEQIAINWTPGATSLDGVRGETYAFINAVIEYYTGSPGVFGSMIAFTGGAAGGGKHIYAIGMDGQGFGRVTSEGDINILPSWGPGGEIMYTSFRRGNPDLYIGSDPGARPLSARPGFNSGAVLSPGGGEIAMTLSVGGNADIYVVNAAGEILRQCTENAAEDVSATWSPDGGQIAFVSDRSGGPQVYVMNSDCSGQRRVTFAGGYNTEPDWSPTGDLIAFTGRDSRNRFDIFTVEPGTGFISRITQDQGDNKSASWSPDGRHLVFSSTRGGSSGSLYVSTADGNYQHNITPDGQGYETPRWQR